MVIAFWACIAFAAACIIAAFTGIASYYARYSGTWLAGWTVAGSRAVDGPWPPCLRMSLVALLLAALGLVAATMVFLTQAAVASGIL